VLTGFKSALFFDSLVTKLSEVLIKEIYMYKYFFMVVTIALLASCGGEESSESTPPPPVIDVGLKFNQWQLANPQRSGTWHGFAVDPSNPRIQYATIDSTVFKSFDGGETWQPSGRGIEPYPIRGYRTVLRPKLNDVIVHPQQTNIVYAASEGNGVYVSTDAGATWRNSITGLVRVESVYYDYGYAVDKLYIHPQAPEFIYTVQGNAPNPYSINETRRIRVSTDRAQTWQEVPLPDNLPASGQLLLNPQTPSVLYFFYRPIEDVRNENWRLYYSADHGTSWDFQPLHLPGITGIPLSSWPSAELALAYLDGVQTFFMATSAGLYTSTDGGAHWIAPQPGSVTEKSARVVVARGDIAYLLPYNEGHRQLYQWQGGEW
jgi:hypothetical protein